MEFFGDGGRNSAIVASEKRPNARLVSESCRVHSITIRKNLGSFLHQCFFLKKAPFAEQKVLAEKRQNYFFCVFWHNSPQCSHVERSFDAPPVVPSPFVKYTAYSQLIDRGWWLLKFHVFRMFCFPKYLTPGVGLCLGLVDHRFFFSDSFFDAMKGARFARFFPIKTSETKKTMIIFVYILCSLDPYRKKCKWNIGQHIFSALWKRTRKEDSCAALGLRC